MLKAASNLEQVLAAGHFAVTAAISSPRHADGESIKHQAKILHGYVDACMVSDNCGAVVQLAGMAAGALVVQQGQDAIVEINCRDRNRIALQSDLLGAYALGIRNVLCISGSHQSLGTEPAASNVYDLDTVNLIKTVKGLRDEKKFYGGDPCLKEPHFYIGCAINASDDCLELQLIQLGKKLEAGADFVQTQVVEDLERFVTFMSELRKRGLHHKAKILASVSLNQGLATCLEQIEFFKKVPGLAGVHIIAPGQEDLIPTLVQRLGLLPRPEIRLYAGEE